MRHVLRPLVLAGAALLASPASAYRATESSDPVPWSPPPFVEAGDGAARAWAATPEAAALLAASHDGAWQAVMDARTGVPGVLRVTVPLTPGPFAPWPPGSVPDLAPLRAALEAFAGKHAAAFGIDPSVLVLEERALAPVFDGRLVAADFTLAPFGIAADDARFSLRVVRGRVVEIDAVRVVPAGSLDPSVRVAADAAAASVLATLGASKDAVEMEDAGTLRWLPLETPDGGLRWALTWRVALRLPDSPSLWEARVDARTGEILALRDAAHWACPVPPRGTLSQARGGVLPRYPWETDVMRGLPYVKVTVGPTTYDTDLNGLYAYPGGTGSSVLQSVPSSVTCFICSNPASARATVDTVTGDADYGLGGANTTGNSISLKAERTSLWHVNRVHALASKWLTPAQVPDGITLNVNYTIGTCNGVFSGNRIYLFPEDATCVNTGEHPSVIQHEWGHGLDQQVGPAGNWGEGCADHVDMLTNRDSRGAPGFYKGTTDGLREADETRVPLRAWPASECGGEVHCLGEVYNQAGWHLARLLRADARFGEESGWHLTEALFFGSLPQASEIGPGQPGSIYDAYANALDALFGDGNVINGVPLAGHLNAAFQHHGMAPATPFTEQAYPCATPPQAPLPAATVVGRDATTGRPRVTLTWTDPFGVAYDVLRSESGASYSKLKLGTVPAGTTTFTDTLADLGSTYVYALFPRLATDCYARMDAMLTVTVQGGSLALDSFTVDAAGDGALSPGETVDVVPRLRNVGPDPATNVTAVLEPGDPLVTLVQPTSNVGTLAAGATASGSAWRVTLSPSAPCNGSFDVPVRLQSDQGCSMTTLTLRSGEDGAALSVTAVAASDPLPAANGNGTPEPGETLLLTLDLAGTGSDPAAVARAVTGVLSSADPRVTILDGNVAFGDVATGATVRGGDTAQVAVDAGMPCGGSLPFRLDLTGSNGCWSATFDLVLAGPRVVAFQDPEQQATEWSVSGDATEGAWRRQAPLGVAVGAATMPSADVTADPGHLAWVTEAVTDVPGLDDVDGGCTTLTLDVAPVLSARPVLSYWRAFGWDGDPATASGDGLIIDAFDASSGQSRPLERVTATAGWERREFDLEALFGTIPGRLRLDVTACDAGGDSLVEAMLDEVRLEDRPCAPAAAAPVLEVIDWILDDSAGGDGSGTPEPGETVDVRVRLRNAGAADARAIAGTLSLATPVPGVTVDVPDDAWTDLAPGAEGLDVAAFRLRLDASTACGTRLPLQLDGRYDADAGPGRFAGSATLVVGRPVPGPVVAAATWDFEAGPADGWIHWPVSGEDDWQAGAPAGLAGDPAAAHSGAACWGTDLGLADPRFARDGQAAAGSVRRLESPPADVSGLASADVSFWHQLGLGAGDHARAFVNGALLWESPPGPVSVGTWTEVVAALPAAVAGQSPLVLTFELETAPGSAAPGWSLDLVSVSGPARDVACDCVAPSPSPLGDVLRVTRSGNDATLDWRATTSDASSYRILRRVSARQFPATGTWGVVADQAPGTAWSESDGASSLPLAFYEVRPLNECGDE